MRIGIANEEDCHDEQQKFLYLLLHVSFGYEKGVQPFFLLALTLGYRQVTFSYNKHRMVHAHEREPFCACSRRMNVWRYSKLREQELKAQYLFYMFISSIQNGNALSVIVYAARLSTADF